MENFFCLFDSAEELSKLFSLYGEWVVFLSVFLTGETAVLTSFALVEQEILSFWVVFFTASAATLAADLFWFFVGRYFPANLLPKRITKEAFSSAVRILDNMMKGRFFITLLITKFFIGTRLMIILYYSRKPISTVRFVVYDVVSVLVYMGVLSVVGLAIGRIIATLIPSYHSSSAIVSVVLLVFLILYIAKVIISNKLQKKGLASLS